MISGTLLLLLLLGLFGAVFWFSRPRGGRDHSGGALPGSAAPLPVEAQEYLSQLDSALGLPADIRADIRAELSDHIADSIAAIEAEGLDQERAVREALARLGRPPELARQLRHAHQTTRRLLAGAAGGVFQAGLGVVIGYIWSWVIFVAVTLLLGTVLQPALNYAAEHLPEWSPAVRALFTSAVPLALMSLLPAFIAGRWSVRALTRGSRRPPAQVARWWALGGTLIIAWYVVFGVTAEQSWLAIPLELLIPVAFAAGALWRTHRTLFMPRWRVPIGLIAATLVVVLVAGLAGASMSTSGSTSASYWFDDGQLDAALDKIAPPWPGELALDSSWGSMSGPVIQETWVLEDPRALTNLRDARFELWRAVPVEGSPDSAQAYLLAPGYAAAFATMPADTSSGTFTARFDVGHVRTTHHWLLLLTAVGPDGVRYRVDWRSQMPAHFSGTIWDWLKASE